MIDVHQNLVLSRRFCGEVHKLPHLTHDVTGQHYRPVLSDVSLPRLSERRRRLKFRLDGHPYISLLILKFLNRCISVKTFLINTKLGDFVNLGVLFLTMRISSC